MDKQNMDKQNIIMQLASSMGHGTAVTTLHGPSRYDAGTKTLYCDGKVIGKASIEDAKLYFEEQKAYLKASPNGSLQDANTYISYFDTAIEAITWMLEQKDNLER